MTKPITVPERTRRLLIYCLVHGLADEKSMAAFLAACYHRLVNQPDVPADENLFPASDNLNNSLAMLDAMKDCLNPDEEEAELHSIKLREWTISRRGRVKFL